MHGWWFLVVFVAALSLFVGVAGARVRDADAVALIAIITMSGMIGLWMLPPALSPGLLDALPRRNAPPPGDSSA